MGVVVLFRQHARYHLYKSDGISLTDMADGSLAVLDKLGVQHADKFSVQIGAGTKLSTRAAFVALYKLAFAVSV